MPSTGQQARLVPKSVLAHLKAREVTLTDHERENIQVLIDVVANYGGSQKAFEDARGEAAVVYDDASRRGDLLTVIYELLD